MSFQWAAYDVEKDLDEIRKKIALNITDNKSDRDNISDSYHKTIEKIKLICDKFYQVSRQMRSRYNNRSTLEMNEQKSELESYFNQWQRTEEQVDDVCVIGIKV